MKGAETMMLRKREKNKSGGGYVRASHFIFSEAILQVGKGLTSDVELMISIH